MYSQSCIRWSPFGQRESDRIRKVTIYLSSINRDYQKRPVVIHILLLPEMNFWEKWWSLCILGFFLLRFAVNYRYDFLFLFN